jgi:hypothetical protein
VAKIRKTYFNTFLDKELIVLITIAMDSNLYLKCYHDNESKKTIVSSQTLMQYMEQQRQKAVERERYLH